MDERIVLWILGSGIGLITTAVLYILRELSEVRKRLHDRNNEFSTRLTEIQINAKGVSEMVKANEKASDDTKKLVLEIQKTIARLGGELSRLLGQLSKD